MKTKIVTVQGASCLLEGDCQIPVSGDNFAAQNRDLAARPELAEGIPGEHEGQI